MYVRWVQTADHQNDATSFFRSYCDRVRIVPFIIGVPTSIHGLVFPQGVAVFRPVEIVTANDRGDSRLHYSGCATFWDPPDAQVAMMRRAARLVGKHLREAHGYRGAFGIDGIVTERGFVPTELNPRFPGGLETLASAMPHLPLFAIHMAQLGKREADWRVDELESEVIAAADANRVGAVHLFTRSRFAGRTSYSTPIGDVTAAPRDVGSILRVDLDHSQVPFGPAVGTLAIETLVEVGRGLRADDIMRRALVDLATKVAAAEDGRT